MGVVLCVEVALSLVPQAESLERESLPQGPGHPANSAGERARAELRGQMLAVSATNLYMYMCSTKLQSVLGSKDSFSSP